MADGRPSLWQCWRMFESWQVALLEECRVGRLATVGGGGRPHLVPVCYALVEGLITIPVDEKPKRTQRLARLRNIERDPRATFLVDRYDEDWSRLAWVRIDGRAEVVARGELQPGAVAALRLRYPQYGLMRLELLPLVLITPEHVAGWRWAGA